MPGAIADIALAWHDFYVVIGTASATLIGAMFVVVSIGSGFLTQERALASRTFLTPTAIHLSTVLFGCALVVVPGLSWEFLGALIGIGSAAGLAYSAVVALRVAKHKVDVEDRLWYAVLPPLGYAVMAAAAWTAFRHGSASFDFLAGGLVIVLLAGMRNAWDMILFLVQQAGRRDEPPLA